MKRNNKWNNTILFSFSVPCVGGWSLQDSGFCRGFFIDPLFLANSPSTPSSLQYAHPFLLKLLYSHLLSFYVLPPLHLQGNLPSYPFPVATSTETPHQTSRTMKFKLGSTYEREDKTFVCVALGYITQYNYSQFHLFTCDLHFSLWLNNITLCICMNICVSYVHGPFTG